MKKALIFTVAGALVTANAAYAAYVYEAERTQCIQEYIDMNKDYIPKWGDFVDAGSYVDPGNFPFDEINVNAHYNIAIFKIANHLQNIRNELGHPMKVNSGYRNPNRNAEVGGKKESQHLYGTAADIKVIDFNNDGATNGNMVKDPNYGLVGDDWAVLANLARNEGAWIEPWGDTGSWVHMDWR